MSDYKQRAKQFGFAQKGDVVKTIQDNPSTVILDVRRQDEIESSGKFQVDDHAWVTSSCTPDSCQELEAKAKELLPDKEGELPPIVQLFYCLVS